MTSESTHSFDVGHAELRGYGGKQADRHQQVCLRCRVSAVENESVASLTYRPKVCLWDPTRPLRMLATLSELRVNGKTPSSEQADGTIDSR